jgi:hypothetical protein
MRCWFNTAGLCQADIHYMLLPTQRLPDLERLIEQRNYFVIHAPRQTGKTTLQGLFRPHGSQPWYLRPMLTITTCRLVRQD